ncbi:hypothetical protein PI124_g3006 [Phytophthora idaei]|nr:hypothetical protein PI125_g5789 [Phytophthora idaei]KAG3170836.1 hypothetical protein PI126_g2175 [Phytophthora idaei]KAG3252412.1 hypothetical protein PI124_g3006 [Phytophthora idaei]
MGKLLAWGGALFLVHCERGKLQIQRVDVNADEKKALLRICSVKDDGDAVLPVNARLVAAKEVEDIEIATRYPVLVFQASGKNDTELTSESSASRKRRRSTKDKGAISPEDGLRSSRAGNRLFFCILYETESGGEIGWRLLNMLEIPTRVGECDDGQDLNSLQYFLTDGPHVLLFQRCSQVATVLKLQRANRGGGGCGFYVWREQVDVVHGIKGDTSAPCELVSCAYVSETHCTRPHLLIHVQRFPRSSLAESENHPWSILDLDYEGRAEANKETSQCHYLQSATGFNEVMSKPEQVTCCCFVSEMSEWNFTASAFSETAAISSWDYGPSTTRSSRTDIRVSTLVVTGTTSNTIHVHESGILLVSYVLPTRPAEMWVLCEDNLNQHHVLCVRCDDENRSFFMLGFSSSVQNVSMDLLLSFNRVGHAYTGNFAGVHAGGAPASRQVLLLNDVPGVIDTSAYSVENELGADRSVDNGQLVKRSVLVTQKTSASEVKLSCHRLRLREDNKSKNGSRPRKRSRSKPEPFHYIERTQKASSHGMEPFDKETDGPANALAASQSQLGKLVSSLSGRLSNGLQELGRLQKIVGDKYSLARQLNQLIAQQWEKQQTRARHSKEHAPLTSLLSSHEVDSLRSESKGLVDMETIVSAPSSVPTIPRNAAIDEAMEYVPGSSLGDLKLVQQVSLEQFRVLEYVPSSSLIRAEVYLKNLSDSRLDDSFVVLTAPKGASALGWRCSCSVVPEFPPVTSMADHTAGKVRFQLELQFAPTFYFLRERKPLEMMLWLHWGASRDNHMTLDWRPSESALAVAPVKIHPSDVLGVGRKNGDGGAWTEDQERLLFISSGSNLGSLFAQPSVGVSSSAASVIRPTFSLVDLNVRSRELMLYELSRMVANIPPDVYVMRNPLQHTHLRALQIVLRSMRQDTLASQQQKSKEKLVGEFATHRKQRRKTKDQDPASIHRSMQRDTDLHAIRLLQELQKRANFHTMWFDANQNIK